MDVLGLLFSFRGRVGRLAYFAASLTTAIAVSAVAAFLAVMFFESAFSAMDRTILFSALPLLLVIVALWAASTWVSGALAVKRLRDMGRSPWHAAWIVGSYAFVMADPTYLLVVVCLIGWTWLVAFPGHHAQPAADVDAASVHLAGA